MKRFAFRLNPQPPPDLPLTVRSVGEQDFAAGAFAGSPQHRPFTHLYWTEKGVGEFRLAKRWIRSCGAFLRFPGERHDMRPVTPWKVHWLTLDHPDSRRWVETMVLGNCPPSSARCPVKLFRALQREVSSGTADADRRACHLAHAILLEIGKDRCASPPEHHSTRVEECRARIDTGFADPGLNITVIANEMGLHRATLFRAFTTAYGMNPSYYLQSRRMHHAMQLLKETNASVKEVSVSSGFTDPNYFARILRRICGLRPHEFRDAYHRGEPLDENLRRRFPVAGRTKIGKRVRTE